MYYLDFFFFNQGDFPVIDLVTIGPNDSQDWEKIEKSKLQLGWSKLAAWKVKVAIGMVKIRCFHIYNNSGILPVNYP